MGIDSGHREADSGGPLRFLAAGDSEMEKGATGWDLAAVRGQNCYEGGGDSGRMGKI